MFYPARIQNQEEVCYKQKTLTFGTNCTQVIPNKLTLLLDFKINLQTLFSSSSSHIGHKKDRSLTRMYILTFYLHLLSSNRSTIVNIWGRSLFFRVQLSQNKCYGEEKKTSKINKKKTSFSLHESLKSCILLILKSFNKHI